MATMGVYDSQRRSMLRLVSCCCIALNSLTAGSIFVFALYGPVITKRMSLTMAQTNFIAVGAIVAEYLSAAVWGNLVDRKGPQLVSLAAAVLFASGYTLMARSIPDQGASPSLQGPWLLLPSYILPPDYVLLASFYVLAGSATSASYFSAVSTSAKSFPRHGGLAIGIPCAIFGLSPLFLSKIANWAFLSAADPDELDVRAFLSFLAGTLLVVNLLGAIGLRELPPLEEEEQDKATDASETSPLLPSVAKADEPQTLSSLVREPAFWSLGVILFLVTGPAEMVQASIGSLIESLVAAPVAMSRPWPPPSALRIRATHVQVISLFNTFSRLVSGALADGLAPTPGSRARSWTVSRLWVIAAIAASFALACVYVATALTDTYGAGLWVLSVSTGIAYGCVFTLTPSIVSIVWPLASFGRNWGLISYFSAAGSILYAGLYGIVSDAHVVHGATCAGPQCFRLTFWLCATGSLCAAVLALWLWHRPSWRGKV